MGKEPDEESSVEAGATTQAGAGAHTGRAGGSERTAPGKALAAGPTGPDGQAGRKPAQAELAGAESAGGGRAAGRGARTAPQRARGVATLLEAGAETPPDLMCSIARSLCVLGERWTFLILREAFFGVSRFSEFRDRLGIAPDVLTDRLATLTEAGVLTRELYQEPGRRGRYAYHLTPAGDELRVVLGSLQQWGDQHLPPPGGPTVVRRARDSGAPLHVGYVDDQGREVALDDVEFVRTANYPTSG